MRYKVTTTQYNRDDEHPKRRTVTVEATGFNITDRGVLLFGSAGWAFAPDEWARVRPADAA